jgi:hypothetical protein
MDTQIKKTGYYKHYIIPFFATVAMIIFAFIYEPVTPLWWVLATAIIAVSYGYYFKKAQKTK